MTKSDLYRILQKLHKACPGVLFVNLTGGSYRYGPFLPKYKCVYVATQSGKRKDIIAEGDEILIPMVDIQSTEQVEADLLDLLADAKINHPSCSVLLLTSFSYDSSDSQQVIHYRACSVVFNSFEENSLVPQKES